MKKEEEQIDETYELESELVDLIKADVKTNRDGMNVLHSKLEKISGIKKSKKNLSAFHVMNFHLSH